MLKVDEYSNEDPGSMPLAQMSKNFLLQFEREDQARQISICSFNGMIAFSMDFTSWNLCWVQEKAISLQINKRSLILERKYCHCKTSGQSKYCCKISAAPIVMTLCCISY